MEVKKNRNVLRKGLIVTTSELTKMLGCNATTIGVYVADGMKFIPSRPGAKRGRRFSTDDVIEFLRSRSQSVVEK